MKHNFCAEKYNSFLLPKLTLKVSTISKVLYPLIEGYLTYSQVFHCMKSVRILSFSSACFPAFGLNTERYRVFSPNSGKYGPEKLQIRTLFTQCFPLIYAFLHPHLKNEHVERLLFRFLFILPIFLLALYCQLTI